MKYILSSASIVCAVLAFVLFTVALTSFAFADSRGRGVQSAGESRRTETLTRVLTILEEHVPEQAQSPEAVAEALANEPGNSSEEENGSGNNGGTSAGNGGNGGNSSPGGLVKAGGAVSNSTALNAINTVILRISFR